MVTVCYDVRDPFRSFGNPVANESAGTTTMSEQSRALLEGSAGLKRPLLGCGSISLRAVRRSPHAKHLARAHTAQWPT